MKSYIILTPEIGNMGGGQMYTNNKVLYLKEHGWDVQVFYFKEGGPIKMPHLKDYDGNVIPEFRCAFYYVPEHRRARIARNIKSIIIGSEDIVIESQLIDLAFWGEDIASRIGANHIVNYIEEQVPLMDDRKLKFFEYKLTHWQMLNAGEGSQKRVFKDKWKSEYLHYLNPIVYKCSNVVYNVDTDVRIIPSNYTIMTIGRLDKPYIDEMTDEFVKFASKHKDNTINIIYVGGSPDGMKEKQIQDRFLNISNVHLYMLGYCFPVPQKLIDAVDVAVASANSILVTSDQDIPTISLDMNDHKAIGVYGYDTENKFKRSDKEPQVNISNLLEDILLYGKYPRKGKTNDSMADVIEEFDREVLFLERSVTYSRAYYNLNKIKSKGECFYCQIKWFIHHIIKKFK